MINKVFTLRHGIRLDNDDNTYLKHYLKRRDDVPLSYRGIIQAQETGEFLKKENISHIFCSPFFRTLQTAHIVADKLDLSVQIEHGFIEMLHPDWFDAAPELISLKEASEIFPRVNTKYQSYIQPQYPEADYEGQVLYRVKEALDQIIQHYDGTILVVGHGASTESAAKALMLPNPLEHFNGKMCALNMFEHENGQWKFTYGSTKHLSAESID